MNRKKIVQYINPAGLGLEIGPSFNPVFPKREGYNVKVLDHASREELVLKFKDLPADNYDLSKIEDVDYVWHGQPYAELIKDCRFDWIFASHVIEHTPDLIGFINNCVSVLKDDGSLVLVIPDRRYTLDYYRYPSSFGAVIDAHYVGGGKKQPSIGDIMDCYCYSAQRPKALSDLKFSRNPTADLFNHHNSETKYTDVHVWNFTPSHFRLLVEDLFSIGAIKVHEAGFINFKNEFLIFLSKKGGANLSRMQLSKRANKEHRVLFNRGRAGFGNFISQFDSDYCFGVLKKIYKRIRK